MPLTEEDIANAIERTLIDSVPLRRAVVEAVEIDGVRAIYTANLRSPGNNIVGQAQLDENTVDATIEKVINFYKSRHHHCSWITSDASKPANLSERLAHYGFQKLFDLAGLYLDDFEKAIRPNPRISIRCATEADTEQLIHLYSEAYPMPVEEVPMLLENIAVLNGRNYLAYVDDSAEPVSVANMFYLSDKPIVALEGAATLPEYRGRGIYTSLVSKRLEDACADGMHVAIMQADMETSAPICMKLGFKKLCDMAIYVWLNTEEDVDEE